MGVIQNKARLDEWDRKKYYIRFADLSQEEQEKFWEFLRATARSRPIVEGEDDCAWRQDYKEFRFGADPYAGLRTSEKYAGKLGAVVEKKKIVNRENQMAESRIERLPHYISRLEKDKLRKNPSFEERLEKLTDYNGFGGRLRMPCNEALVNKF